MLAMLRLLFAVIVVLSVGCASGNGEQIDPCERALQRLVDECDYTIEGAEDLKLNCTGASACVAVCLESSPCADIAANDGEFSDCAADCQ